ncbi:rhomboid family intramembrane serine protease [Hyphobacterium sp.]|uniref:rhomboid family intramembrane serine protease n=1 Tax=Hyphobacterium sp. TaxID=2004662 RepID=UPI003BA8E49A
MRPARQPIFNNVPPVPLALAVSFVAVFAIGALVPDLNRQFFQIGAVVPALGLQHPSPLGPWSPYIFHVFLHGGIMHLVFNSMAMLTFGAGAFRPFGGRLPGISGFLLFFLVCSIAGAGFQVLVAPDSMTPMIGASTGVSGLLAAAGWAEGGYRGMLRYAVPWAGFNILLFLLGPLFPIPISWAGHLGGLIAGALLFPVFVVLFGARRRA